MLMRFVRYLYVVPVLSKPIALMVVEVSCRECCLITYLEFLIGWNYVFMKVIAAAEVHAKLLVSTYFHLNLQGTPAATFGMRRRLRRGPISERLVIVV